MQQTTFIAKFGKANMGAQYCNSSHPIANYLYVYRKIVNFFQFFFWYIHLQYTFAQPFQNGSIKVKCTAMLQNVYLKSNEISFEVKKRLQNIPALEIREKNGKKNSKGKSYSKSLIRLGLNLLK